MVGVIIMFNFFRKFFPKKAKKSLSISFEETFFKNIHHQWIKSDDRLNKIFIEFFQNIPNSVKAFFTAHPLLILKANKKFSCCLDIPSGYKVILVFPDLNQRLNSVYYEDALAILAHEIGHLYYQHSEKSIDPLEAQVAADSFAAQLGHYKSLVKIIEEEAHGIEAKVRLVYLNSKYMFADGQSGGGILN